jgi:hypothetical protein
MPDGSFEGKLGKENPILAETKRKPTGIHKINVGEITGRLPNALDPVDKKIPTPDVEKTESVEDLLKKIELGKSIPATDLALLQQDMQKLLDAEKIFEIAKENQRRVINGAPTQGALLWKKYVFLDDQGKEVIVKSDDLPRKEIEIEKIYSKTWEAVLDGKQEIKIKILQKLQKQFRDIYETIKNMPAGPEQVALQARTDQMVDARVSKVEQQARQDAGEQSKDIFGIQDKIYRMIREEVKKGAIKS